LTNFPHDSPSPEVAKLADSSTVKRPQLGDARVTLHLRFVERERLICVSDIKMIKMSLQGDCPEQIVDVTAFADPVIRRRELERIRCLRNRRDIFQRGTHDAGLEQEKSIRDLKLPPYTEESMLSRQRDSNRIQDSELAATFRDAEAVDTAIERYVNFLESRAQSMRMVNGRYMFANATDAATFDELQNSVVKTQSELKKSP
jgi:hypothetical protein